MPNIVVVGEAVGEVGVLVVGEPLQNQIPGWCWACQRAKKPRKGGDVRCVIPKDIATYVLEHDHLVVQAHPVGARHRRITPDERI